MDGIDQILKSRSRRENEVEMNLTYMDGKAIYTITEEKANEYGLRRSNGFVDETGYEGDRITDANLKNPDLEVGRTWIELSKKLYNVSVKDKRLKGDFLDPKTFEGNPLDTSATDPKTDKEFAEWGLNHIGQLEYNLTSLGMKALETGMSDDADLALSLYQMFSMYDELPLFTKEGTARAVVGMATDPFAYLGIGTLGAATVGKQILGGLTKTGLKKGLANTIKKNYGNDILLAVEGGLYAGSYDAFRQTFGLKSGEQEDFNVGSTATMAGTGAVLGPVVGRAANLAGRGIAAGSSRARQMISNTANETRKQDEGTTVLRSGVRPSDIAVAVDDTLNLIEGKPNLSEVQNVLAARSEQMKLPTDKRVQPSGENKLFDTSQQSYENLQVEQKEVEVPRNTTDNPMPIRNRTKPVIDMSDQIAQFLANKIKPQIGTNVQYFYHTGPLIDKAIELGISKDKAVESLKKFALNYAVTSPRTMTEQNLRNASLVSTKENLNIPMTELIGPGGEGINEKGYPMMLGPTGIHTKLINDKQVGQLDIDSNPKPITFAENVTGNLEGVTVDTHAIRAVFYAMNQIKPGSIPIDFIGGKTAKKTKEFQEMYKNDPNSIDFATMINDTLAKQVIDGKEKQTEYAVFSDIYKQVAKLAGVKPAEAQSLSWFANGEITGLASEPKTIVDLIDDRVDVTSQIIGQTKEQVFKKFFQGALPLLSIPASTTLLDTGADMENDDGN